MQQVIKTTGQLREFLAQAILDVKDGKLNLDQASRITKLAAQINESFYSEMKVAQVGRDLQHQVPPLGNLPINGEMATLQ